MHQESALSWFSKQHVWINVWLSFSFQVLLSRNFLFAFFFLFFKVMFDKWLLTNTSLFALQFRVDHISNINNVCLNFWAKMNEISYAVIYLFNEFCNSTWKVRDDLYDRPLHLWASYGNKVAPLFFFFFNLPNHPCFPHSDQRSLHVGSDVMSCVCSQCRTPRAPPLFYSATPFVLFIWQTSPNPSHTLSYCPRLSALPCRSHYRLCEALTHLKVHL